MTARLSRLPIAIRKMCSRQHTHEFCELVLVWRGNGLHVLNDRPYRITRGDLFYIRAEDRHSYTSVNDLVLQNIIYCPERLTLNLGWESAIPGFNGSERRPHWRLGSVGMNQARQVISQLEHESNQGDPLVMRWRSCYLVSW